MATLSQDSNLVVADTTSPLGAAALAKEHEIHADAPVVMQGPITYAVSGGSDTAVALGSITAATGYWVEIQNHADPETGDDLNLSTGTGGSFAGAIFGQCPRGGVYHGFHKVAIYAKSSSASVTVSASHRAVERKAP